MVDRVHAKDLPVEQFMADYWVKGKPVVIQGAIEDWKARQEWNLQSLCERLGERTVSCRQTHHSSYRNGSRYTTQKMKFSKYIETLLNPRSGFSKSGEKRTYYLAVQNIKEVFPELNEEYQKPTYCPKVHRGPFLWIAPASHFEYTHFDPDDNFLVVVKGTKHVKLFSPACLDMMYPHPLGSLGTTIQSQLDLSEDSFEDFPKFNLDAVQECDVNEGEMLFIPYGYWHQVTSPEVVISINFFCGDASADDFLAKLFSQSLYPTFSYWVLNLIEQNRRNGSKPMQNTQRYSDSQLEDCLQQFFITRYHSRLKSEQVLRLIELTREYCTMKDKEEGIPLDDTPAEKPPRIKIRGLKWRIQGMTMKSFNEMSKEKQ
mmetsp:Transcript_19302/g.24399  ORF Transcript_19302/g.24399 Transcript_19302/m.24399 type:complete len:373 (-) Transcript_19302:638-1756(-)